jgi:hypothetical protein
VKAYDAAPVTMIGDGGNIQAIGRVNGKLHGCRAGKWLYVFF